MVSYVFLESYCTCFRPGTSKKGVCVTHSCYTPLILHFSCRHRLLFLSFKTNSCQINILFWEAPYDVAPEIEQYTGLIAAVWTTLYSLNRYITQQWKEVWCLQYLDITLNWISLAGFTQQELRLLPWKCVTVTVSTCVYHILFHFLLFTNTALLKCFSCRSDLFMSVLNSEALLSTFCHFSLFLQV